MKFSFKDFTNKKITPKMCIVDIEIILKWEKNIT